MNDSNATPRPQPRSDHPSVEREATGLEIAIIGLHGRFPGARNVDELWQVLQNGVDTASELADETLAAAGIDPRLASRPEYVKRGHLLDEPELFDAGFFDYNAREAALIDPQQRLFLECSWEILEQAGYDPARFPGRIGVVASVSHNGYYERVLAGTNDPIVDFEARISNDKDFVATRVAYKLNLRGPSFTVQTACSSSLVAVHLGCQSLINGEADMVIAGGATIRLPQGTGYLYEQGFILSPDGRCRAFDADAEGCNFGNGVAMVLLKRLADAVADGDDIQAVLLASALNNDGALKAGFTAPSFDGQAEAIAEALGLARVDAGSIGFIETHGTGTRLGDPIEIAALTKVYRSQTQARGVCGIGSIKTNLGHLDAAAGAAGLIKAALVLKHGVLPPSLYFTRPNPELELEASPFYVVTERTPWPAHRQPRRAAVSAFGIGGTNAHAVLEQAPTTIKGKPSTRPHQLLMLSAKSESALAAAGDRLAAHLRTSPEADLADVAYTLHVGRSRLPYRGVVVCRDHEDAVAALSDPERFATVHEDAAAVPTVFLFPGGGAQYPGMGLDLYRSEPVYRQEIDRCAELLRTISGADLLANLFPPAERAETARAEMQRTSIALPALFATEYALARLLMSWGVRPTAMIGHSLGEYTAACLAGVLTLEDALRVVDKRGQLFERLPPGSMLSVPMPESELLPLLGEGLSIAAVNTPELVVVSGRNEDIARLAATLAARGVEAKRVHIDVAAHSPMVEPILDEFRTLLRRLRFSPPAIPFLSNVTGSWAHAEGVADPEYWAQHLRRTVRFADGLKELLATESQVLLEVGPGRTLSQIAMRSPMRKRSTVVLSALRHPQDPGDDDAFLLNTVGKLWLWGVDLDWAGYHREERRTRVRLPTYPFERERYLVETSARSESTTRPNSDHTSAPLFALPAWSPSLPPLAGSALTLDISAVLAADASSAAKHWAESLAESLRRSGARAVVIVPASEFACRQAEVFELDPTAQSDWQRLLEALAENGARSGRFVLTHGVGNGATREADRSRALSTGLALSKAVGKEGVGAPLEIVVLSSGLHDLAQATLADPADAALLATALNFPQKTAGLRVRIVDLPEPPSAATTPWLRDELLHGCEAVIAYRDGRRWVPAATPVELPPTATVPREGGRYVLFSSAGTPEAELARRLASRSGRLTLCGEADEIDALASELRTLGAEVEAVAVTPGKSADPAEAIARARRRFNGLDGIFLTVTSAPAALEDDAHSVEQAILAPLAQLDRLARAVADLELEVCVITTELGGHGEGSIDRGIALAAEAFVANRHGRDRTPWLCVTRDSWARSAQARAREVSRATALERALAGIGAGQLLVAPRTLSGRFDHRPPERAAAAPERAASAALHARPKLSSSYVAPRTSAEEAVVGILEALLGVQPIGIYDDFFEMGGTSLLAARLVARLRDAFGSTLAVSTVFEATTAAALTEKVSRAHGELVGAEMEVGEI